MDPALYSEILGDWNNLKGTAYHFVYTVWRILKEKDVVLAFYRGNDLVARMLPPPSVDEPAVDTYALHLTTQEHDEWIQLKATQESWVLARLFGDNLLLNFICNALASEAAGRTWYVRLVTQGQIDRSRLLDFLKAPQSYSRHTPKFDATLRQAQDRWEQNGHPRPDDQHVREIATAILKQLAEQKPAHMDTMAAEIKEELVYRFVTRGLVDAALRALLGGLLDDASGGPDIAHVYDAAWLDAMAGTPLRSGSLLETHPASACDKTVQDYIASSGAPTLDMRRFVPRSGLTDEFSRFLRSPKTVFVLVGMSGVGKTWALAQWMSQNLAGRARLLIHGSRLDLERQRDIATLVAQPLRPYSPAVWQDDAILLQMEALARERDRGPLILALDDLQPTGDIRVYRRVIAQLVDACRTRGIKLILSCQAEVWDRYRLDRALRADECYLIETGQRQIVPFLRPTEESNSTLPGSKRTDEASTNPTNGSQEQQLALAILVKAPPSLYSVTLGDFTAEEQQQAISFSFSPIVAERVTLALRAKPFLSLRRPYMLDLYLRYQGARLSLSATPPTPIEVDTLLDTRIDEFLFQIAEDAQVDETELRAAFDTVLARLWAVRPNGLSSGEAEECLRPVLGGQCVSTLEVMRRRGLLTAQGAVRLAEAPIAERLFARTLIRRISLGEVSAATIPTEVRPEPDGGVITALLRALPVREALAFGERLWRSDPQWGSSVAQGLAQGPTPDASVLAFLTILAHPAENIIGFTGCDALGMLAARDKLAYKWVARMFVSDHPIERYRGARALATAFEYAPKRVTAAVHLRLAYTSLIDMSSSSGHEDGDEWLRESLTPFLNVQHRQGASTVRTLLERPDLLPVQDEKGNPFWRFQRDLAEIRGQVALFVPEEWAQVQTEVNSPDPTVRMRGATVLRSMMFDAPERIRDLLCAAIAQERDPDVLRHLLWADSRICEIAPDQLFDALTSASAFEWDTPVSFAGQVFATLSNLAVHRPEKVASVLPTELDAYPSGSRAWLSEGLTYAWWVCAERFSDARRQLENLTTPLLADAPDEFQIFALRGAAIAQLGLLCLDLGITTGELHGLQIVYPSTDLQFCFIEISEFIQQHARDLVSAPALPRLIDLLRRCEQELNRVPTHPLMKALFSGRTTAANQSFETLVTLAAVHVDPVALIRDFTSDWHPFEAARRLLEAGRSEDTVRAYVQALCEASIPANGRTLPAIGERDRCLQLLGSLQQAPLAVLESLQADRDHILFGARDRAAAVARLADEHHDELLAILGASIQTEHDLPTLYFWETHAGSWPALLLLHTYARMFDMRALTLPEAAQICEDTLLALGALPPSQDQARWSLVFATIRSWLSRSPQDIAVWPSAGTETVIQRSYLCAANLLHDAYIRTAAGQNLPALLDLLAGLRNGGWWEADDVHLRHSAIYVGSGSIRYVFPPIRLAFFALGMVTQQGDIAAALLRERLQVDQLLKRYSQELDPRLPIAEEYLNEYVGAALRVMSDSTLPHERDERLYLARSFLLRRLDQLEEALQLLQQGLKKFAGIDRIRASYLYDLGCTYALLGSEDDCRVALQQCAELQPFTGTRDDWLIRDPELASMRDKSWLKELGQ